MYPLVPHRPSAALETLCALAMCWELCCSCVLVITELAFTATEEGDKVDVAIHNV